MKQWSNATIKIKDGQGNWTVVPGVAGESAYEIAVRNGAFSGTEEQWVNALETERAAAISSIQTAKANALSDIPQSYQELNDSVDDFKDNLVLVQTTQPNDEDNRLWIKSDDMSEVIVPTYEEFSLVSQETDTNSTVLTNYVRGTAETITITTGQVWVITNNTATTQSHSNFRISEYAVTVGRAYILRLRIANTQIPSDRLLAAFTDDSYNVISIVPYTQVSETGWYDRLVVAPTGATKIIFNSYAGNPSLYSTVSEQISGVNNMFYVASGGKPSFTYLYNKNSSTSVTVTLPTTSMYFVKQNGTIVTYSGTATDRVFEVPSGQALVWSLDTNTVSVKARTAVTSNDLVLLIQLYGTVLCGLFKPFYDEIYGDGLRAIQDFVGIPREYDTDEFVSGAIASVREKQIDCGRDMFAFVTDTHNVTSRQHQDSPKILQCIARSTGLNKVVTGGDWIYATGTEAEMYQQMWAQVQAYKSFVSPFAKVYNVRGNHDIHITNGSTRYELTERQIFNVMYADMEGMAHFNESDPLGMYYWFDSGNIRFMCLDSVQPQEQDETSQFQKQVAFFTSAVSDTPSDKKFVWVTHIPMLSTQSTNYAYATNTFLPLINSVAARTVAVFAGHNHEDMMEVVNGVVHVTCDADARVDRDASMRTTDTGAFDVVCINTSTNRCDLIRVGQGENRAFTFGANPAVITLS